MRATTTLTRFLDGASAICAEAATDAEIAGSGEPVLAAVNRLQLSLDLLAEHATPLAVNDTPVELPPTKPVDPPPPPPPPPPTEGE